MLRIRKLYIHGGYSNYLVQSYRQDGKSRERVLFFLGEHKTIEEALQHWRALVGDASGPVSREYASSIVRKLSGYLAHKDEDEPLS